MGLRVMAMGFLYDFTGNSNVSRVITANDTIAQPWFKAAVNYTQPIDLFIMLGHNPVRTTVSSSTFGTYYNALRKARPDVPIQIFGGMYTDRYSECNAYSKFQVTPTFVTLLSTTIWPPVSSLDATVKLLAFSR